METKKPHSEQLRLFFNAFHKGDGSFLPMLDEIGPLVDQLGRMSILSPPTEENRDYAKTAAQDIFLRYFKYDLADPNVRKMMNTWYMNKLTQFVLMNYVKNANVDEIEQLIAALKNKGM